MLFLFRSSKKEKEEAGGPKKALFTPPSKSVKPELPKRTLPENNPPGPPCTPTPSEMGTPRSTSSVESKRGRGRPRKELTMPTLADYPQNASKDELAHWWKAKQSEVWRYQKLSGPEGEDYRRQESERVKRLRSRSRVKEEEEVLAEEISNGDDDDFNDEQRTKSQEQSRIR